MNWLQLTDDNSHALVAFRTLSNDGYIAIAYPEYDSEKIKSDYLPVLSRDGFEFIDGILVKKGQKLSPSILKSLYPNLKPIEVGSYADITIKDERHKWIQAIAHKAIELGYNANGDKVLETFADQRIVKDTSPSGDGSTGSTASSLPADLLIYDGSPESLAKCADAFVIRLARRAQPATYADLERFATIINQRQAPDALMRPLQEAIEAALYRYIATHCPLDDEGFLFAQELYNRQPRMEARTSSSVTLQQYSTPVHLSMIVQNIIGDVGGHTVVEPTIGNGSLVSLLPPTAKVIGCDLDEQRLFQTRQLLETVGVTDTVIQVGDATKVDFRHLNGGEPVRAVIGNPPFGGLPAPVKMHGVKINKIDHQILINALDARADKGVGAFIIGADSYIEGQAGRIDGSSKWLFNYLADHYQLDAVEVSGKVAYSRQGAAFPIRIVVIGDRLVEPKERIITELPVINSMDELWRWSCRMREQYGLADVYVDDLTASPLSQQDALTEALDEPVADAEALGWVELAGMRFTAREVLGRWTLYRDESELVTAAVLGVQNTAAAVLSAVQSIHADVGDDQEFIALMSSPLSLQRDGMKVVVADHLDLDVPAGWLVCNATRPLVGDRVVADGPSNAGRFYAFIDPQSPIAASYLKSNQDLDAKILVLIPKETQIEMVLANNQYAEQYRSDFEGDELYSSLNPRQYLYGKTYREIGKLKSVAENKVTEMQQQREEAASAAKSRSKYIANAIIHQLGKGFAQITGAKYFTVIENGLSFDLPKQPGYVKNGISRVKIILGGNDLYEVVGMKVSSRRGVVTEKEIERHEDVYAETLVSVMEEMTNLSCIMPNIHAKQYGVTLTPDGAVPYQGGEVEDQLPESISGRGYHGSLVPNIERLALASGLGHSFFGRGIYVTTDREDALDYASTDASFNRDLVGRAELLSKQEGIDYNEAKAQLCQHGGTLYEVEYRYDRPFTLSDEQNAFEDESALRMALSEALVPEEDQDRIVRQLQRAEGDGKAVLDVLSRIPTKGQFVGHYATIAGYDAMVLKGIFALRSERHKDKPVEHVVLLNDNQVRIDRSLQISSTNNQPETSSAPNVPRQGFSAEVERLRMLSDMFTGKITPGSREYISATRNEGIIDGSDKYLAVQGIVAALDTVIVKMKELDQHLADYQYISSVVDALNNTASMVSAAKYFDQAAVIMDVHALVETAADYLLMLRKQNGDEDDLIDAYEVSLRDEAAGIRALVADKGWPEVVDYESAVQAVNWLHNSAASIGLVNKAVEALAGVGIKLWDDRLELVRRSDAYSAYSAAKTLISQVSGDLIAQGKVLSQVEAKSVLLSGNELSLADMAFVVFKKHAIPMVKVPDIALAIERRDPDWVWAILSNKNNKASAEVFERATGITLAKTKKGRQPQIDEWAGITPEQRISINAERKAAASVKQAAKDLSYAWAALLDIRLRATDEGLVLNGQEYLLKRYSEGFDRVGSYKKGVATRYTLQGPSTFWEVKDRDFNRFLKLCGQDLRGALIQVGALEQIEAVADVQPENSVLGEYVAELQANMKRVASELPKHRISLADLEGAGCGAWYQANVNGRDVRATDRLVLLSDRYPAEVESLIERGDLPVSSELKSAPLLDEVLSLNGGERLTVQGITRAQGDSLALLTDTDGEGYLIDEALIRLATRAYADVNFIAKRGLVELQDLNGDPLGFITPRSSPSRIEHADLYRQLVSHTLGLPLPLPKKGDDKKAVVKSNTYQTSYQAASRVGPASSMLPVNMETPLKIALQRVIDNHGDIDEYVAGNLSWSVTELGQYLSPEQVDAVALALFAAERGRGFLEGDQTGLGKGRVMAAMARYAALQGKATIFLTETPTLFSDLWRDISDIGSADLFRPFIVNSGVPIFDVITGKRVIPPTQEAERKRALEDGVVPDGCNLVLGTYSQFNREAAKSLKARWLPRAAEGAVLLMDESHNAAGESNTGENLSKAVAVAETVVYSSATSMKDAKNVMIYSKLFPESVNLGSMPETLAAGGEVLQEVLSSMLAEDGVFIRREHDLSNVTMKTVTDHAREARNRDLSDRLASILELMNYLAGDINQLVNARNKDIKDLLERLPESERKGNRMGAVSVNFGSRLFNLYRQFLMAIKVDATVELAKSAVSQGQKPVIILENTMESLLKETILSMAYVADDEVENVVLEDIEVGELTFKDVLTKTLERISSYQESDRYGNVTRTPVSSDEALELIDKIQEEIDQFPYLAVSPIDEIVRRLEKEGIFCDELSGRKTKIVERDGKYFAASIQERPKATIVNDFNSGRSDALILSRAGSTGISLHASEKFRDQRQRVMIELQSAADVNKRVQFFGRVNRKGQVNEPIIATISSGLPGEARPIAMQNAKLRKLSANTTSNQDNAALDDDIPDFLNKLGDRIARQYLENNPSIANRLDIDIEQEDLDGNYFINRLTSRIMMLRVEEQELIYDELTMEFKGELARLDAIGENPLRSRMFDIKASEVSHEVETHGNPYSDSVFDRDIIVRELAYTEKLKPLRCDRVKPLIEEGLREIKRCELNESMMPAAEFLQGMVSYIVSRQDSILRRALPRRKYESVEAALADSEPNAVHKVKDRLRFISANLQELMPGRALRFSSPAGDLIQGVVVGLRLPEKREQLDSTGKYELAIAVPGQTSLVRQSFYSLAADPAFSPLPVYAADGVLRAIDDAPQGEVTRNLTVLDGNLFGAAQRVSEARIGRSALYTDEVGQRQRAMMLSSGVTKEHLAQLPVRVATARIAAEVLRSGIDLTSCQAQGVEAAKQRADHVTLSVSGGELQICVPGSVAKGGHIFKDSDLVAMTGEFRGNRTSMQAKVPASFAEPVLERLYQKGISLFAPSSAKHEIDDIKMSIYANDSCNKTAKSINMK
ncbi:strawberry notch C-terminal domain-containing protein [Aeromonas hydrophila]|uniref:strawberry notch C-terminal domain-containing protein n=1 Tax=Aeromonas hydrophila TaxID=644 RepID=UPI0039F6995D